MVSGESSESRPPPVIRLSVASTAGPPALVTMARCGPRGRGCLASTSAMSNNSEMFSTRNTPARWNAACNTSSLPVNDPVWDAAALAAAEVRPGLMTMMGFIRATSRAADRKARASPMVSMYMTMLRVLGSSPRWKIKSPQPTSIIEPSEIKALKPTFSFRLQSRTAVQSAPLWLMKPTVPGRAMPAANVALSLVPGTMTPRQFGPTMRICPFRASSRTCRSNSTPAAPVSLKPAEMMTTPRTPACAQSRTIPGTDGGGVTITAKSTFSGTARMPGYALRPSTVSRFGLTG